MIYKNHQNPHLFVVRLLPPPPPRPYTIHRGKGGGGHLPQKSMAPKEQNKTFPITVQLQWKGQI